MADQERHLALPLAPRPVRWAGRSGCACSLPCGVSDFDTGTARRWASGAVPGWVPRLALPIAWVVAAGLATALSGGSCPAADPSVCGPDLGWALGASLTLATPVLLIAFPLLGCLTGALFGLYELVAEPDTAARIAFTLHGLACVLVAVLVISSRRRQGRVAAATGIHVPVPGRPPRPEPLPVLVAAVLLAGAVAGIVLWQFWTARDDRHLAAARRVEATVVGEVDDGYSVRLRLPDQEDEATVEVVDHYDVGTVVPVLVDRTGDRPWVAPVGEQPDDTFPLSAGLAAAGVAAAVGGWELTRRRMPARLAAGAPAVTVLAVRQDYEVELWDTDGTAAFAQLDVRPPVPVDDAAGAGAWTGPVGSGAPVRSADDLYRPPPEEDWPAEEQARFGADWRSQPAMRDPRPVPVRVTAVGDLRQGGWVALVDGDRVLWPARTLRVLAPGPSRDREDEDEPEDEEQDDLFRGTPVAAGPGVDVPFEARAPRRARLLGLAMLAGFSLGPLAAAFLAEGWFQTIVVVAMGAQLGFAGLGRVHVGVRLEQRQLVIRERFHTCDAPWAAIHGVRRDEDVLRLAWLPDMVMDVGPFAASPGTTPAELAERIGATVMRQRELALAAGDPGLRPVRRLAVPSVLVAVLYAAAVAATLLLSR